MRVRHLLSTTIVLGALAAAGSAVALTDAGAAAASSPPTVSVKSSPWGKILVNSKGYALYMWVKDKPNKSNCGTACLSVWPFVIVSGKPTAGPGVNAKLLGTIKAKGGNEVTYNKYPLYTFVSDVKPSVISGQGNTTFGGAWWLLTPSGQPITKKKP